MPGGERPLAVAGGWGAGEPGGFGNLVSASTAKMLHDDLFRGDIADGDLICASVVGAGPERGAYVLPVRIATLIEPGTVMAAASWA